MAVCASLYELGWNRSRRDRRQLHTNYQASSARVIRDEGRLSKVKAARRGQFGAKTRNGTSRNPTSDSILSSPARNVSGSSTDVARGRRTDSSGEKGYQRSWIADLLSKSLSFFGSNFIILARTSAHQTVNIRSRFTPDSNGFKRKWRHQIDHIMVKRATDSRKRS